MQIIIKILFTIIILAICYFGISRIWKNEIDLDALLTKPFSFIPTKKIETKLLFEVTHLRRDTFVYLNVDKLTNIDIYLAAKITNTDDKTLEIVDYKVELFANGIWEKVFPIPFLNKNKLYFVSKNNYKNATRVMLEQDIFDYVIRNYQIQPGETIIGIVPLKTEKKLAKIEKVKFTLKDIFKRSYEFNIELENIGGEGQGYLQSLSMEVLDKNVDLSKFISP